MEYDRAYRTSFTFESTQNLSGLMPTITRTAFGNAVPFAPYNGATGEYLTVPADNTSAFTFESTQNLSGLMPTITRTAFGNAVPFAPYNGATGEYLTVPADNTSVEYYRFWAPYCQGQGILEGTDYELKSWTALYYYAASMDGTLSEQYAPHRLVQTRYARR